LSKQNRQKRASKAKERAARQRQPQPQTSPEQPSAYDFTAPSLPADLIANVLLSAAFERAKGDVGAAKECAAEIASPRFTGTTRDIETAAHLATDHVFLRVFRDGYLPEDLFQITRRRLDRVAVSYLVDELAAYLQQFAPTTVHPVWYDQLAQLEAVVWWSRDKPQLGQWAAKNVLDLTEALTTVIELLGLLMTLHPVAVIAPLPGTVKNQKASAHHGVDEKMLSRVRALLAKAESSSFPEEAEALSAKAQELMTRHAVDRVLVEADTSAPAQVSTRRIWLDAPYLDAKSLLINVVSKANRCRAAFHPTWGFMSVLGDENDLESVELLTTSLLVQATKAMLSGGSQTTRGGQSRTRSYRQSFLVAYATRIGERLEQANAATIAEVPDSSRLLPVLVSRQQKVDAEFEVRYPQAVGKHVSVSNAAGWGAGTAAADRAQLETRRAVNGP
jgi:uncharacterized protein DUF2786